jgi:hypothetical protein
LDHPASQKASIQQRQCKDPQSDHVTLKLEDEEKYWIRLSPDKSPWIFMLLWGSSWITDMSFFSFSLSLSLEPSLELSFHLVCVDYIMVVGIKPVGIVLLFL